MKSKKTKLLNLSLILTSFIVYLEWGNENSNYLYRLELELLSKLFTDPLSVLHPFTVLPFIGQVILLVTLFQKKPKRGLSLAGMLLLGFLIYFIFIAGFLISNIKIILFAVPYVIVSILTIIYQRRKLPISNV